MIDVKDATSNLVYDLGRLLLGDEYLMGTLQGMRRMRSAIDCDFRKPQMVDVNLSKPAFF